MRMRTVGQVLGAAAVLLLCIRLGAQTAPPQQPGAKKAQKAAPAPRRDISGMWDVANMLEGISPAGVKAHAPFTALGANIANNVFKPGDGPRKVPIGLVNDPLDSCDPAGFPRNLLFELRLFQIVPTSNQYLILYQYQQVWRVIWKDGREMPKDPDPRWYGYSVGKWEDDYTFVVDTVGMDDRTWLDNAGDPHSDAMHVEERYHRIDHDNMELTVKITDPKFYTEPWLARDKLHLILRPANTEVMEMICAPTEAEAYKKTMANPVSQ
jgi:hypothetical protein